MRIQSELAGMRLLVVDDDPVSRLIVGGLAEKLGHEADAASDGEQALRMLAARRYDLVLMDCEMPHMDGYAACRRLREQEAGTRRTPVVALSAARDEDARLDCLEAGMDDFLFKPLGLNELDALLARWRPKVAAQIHVKSTAADAPDGLETMARRFGSHFAELAALWLNTSPQRLLDIRRALTGGDRALASGTAHTLGGACASIGAQSLSMQCRQLELGAGSADLKDLANLLDRMEDDYRETAARIRKLAQSSAQS